MTAAINSEAGHDPIIIVMVGLPASGKTHLANLLCEQKPGLLRVSSDDLITMHRQTYSRKSQGVVRAAEHVFVEKAMERGFDVIIDRTNLARCDRERWYTWGVGVVLIQVISSAWKHLNAVRPDGIRVPEDAYHRMEDSHERIDRDENPCVLDAWEIDMTPSEFTDLPNIVRDIWRDISGVRP